MAYQQVLIRLEEIYKRISFQNLSIMLSLIKIIFLITFCFRPVILESDMVNSVDQLVAKVLAGIEFTAGYAFSFGTDYPPIDQDVTFWCTMPKQTELRQVFLNDPELDMKIDLRFPVNFLIHGWLGGLSGGTSYLPDDFKPKGWMQSTSIRWAEISNSNVCAVDWSRLANYEYGIAALKHTKKVAEFMQKFMLFLMEHGMALPLTSIAGHSLGAQIAAFVGRNFFGILYAIYGLDPAGPGFTCPFDLGSGTRLDSTCATYVQCIHTAQGSLGTAKPCGHADFYVNGGFVQPGCAQVLCGHSRSHEYFNESLDPTHIFLGIQCKGPVKNFLKSLFGKSCSAVTDRMGIFNQQISGKFYLDTNSAAPFAKT